MSALTIKNLHVSIEGKEILKGLNLEIKQGEINHTSDIYVAFNKRKELGKVMSLLDEGLRKNSVK